MTNQLVIVADIWCAATGKSRARLSTLIFSSGRRLDAIAEGSDLATRSFERALVWLSQTWPEGAVWPDDVARPVTETEEPAA